MDALIYLFIRSTIILKPLIPARVLIPADDPAPGNKSLEIPSLTTFLEALAHSLYTLGLTLCIIGVIVGGIMRATAFGSERRIAASNVALSCAVIGFLIILLASPVGKAIKNALP